MGPTPWQINRSSPMEQVKVLKQEFIPSAHERVDSALKACVIQERHMFQSREEALVNILLDCYCHHSSLSWGRKRAL